MSDVSKTCECGRVFTDAQSSGVWCYRCKLDGLGFNWVGGGGYGRESFHNHTVSEVCAQTERIAHKSGIGDTMTKLSTRAELI